jgi:pimeloyl-ACP methyl ester carboxylesterase
MVRIRNLLAAVFSLGFVVTCHPALAVDSPNPQSFDAKGVKLRYIVQGTGEPVVLIHGLYASAQINWQLPGIVSALAKDHQVIALDLPGHGGSDKPEKEDAYGVQMVEDVVLLMDHLKIKKAHIVGYSMGGMVTAKLLALHPDRILSATLGGMGWMRTGSHLQKFWERMPTRDGARTPSACIRGIADLAITEDELKSIELPVTVLIGASDPVKWLYVTPLQSVRKDWPVIEIEDAGHITCITKQQFKDEIVRWVAKNSKK